MIIIGSPVYKISNSKPNKALDFIIKVLINNKGLEVRKPLSFQVLRYKFKNLILMISNFQFMFSSM